jgi:hypothetical protein
MPWTTWHSFLVCGAWLSLLILGTTTATAQRSNLSGRPIYQCPFQDGKAVYFSLNTTLEVTIRTTTAVGTLCLLSLEQPDGTAIPVARSYDGNDWERSGGKFAASLAEWTCNLFGCASVLPPASNYVLVTRIASSTNGSPASPKRLSAPLSNKVPSRAEVARFLQSASFGATRNDWQTWGTKLLAQHVGQQFALPPTYHRVYFRRRANPRWLFPHPEFAARLDPCAAGATWRRQVLTVKDSQQSLHVQRRVVDAGARWWEIVIGGSVRALVPQLRFLNANRTIVSGAAYQFCSLDEETHRGIYKVTIHGECHQLRTEDLIIDFPASYTPTNRLNGTLASLFNQSAWRPMVGSSTEYISNGIPARQCKSLLAPSIPPKSIFAQTVDGTWLQFDPRIQMKENSVEAPWDDGGTQSWLTNQTLYCSNVPRSFLNEASCRMSTKTTCRAGATSARDVGVGYVVCGSPGEVANNISWGDSWMDVSSITPLPALPAAIKTTLPSHIAHFRESERLFKPLRPGANRMASHCAVTEVAKLVQSAHNREFAGRHPDAKSRSKFERMAKSQLCMMFPLCRPAFLVGRKTTLQLSGCRV